MLAQHVLGVFEKTLSNYSVQMSSEMAHPARSDSTRVVTHTGKVKREVEAITTVGKRNRFGREVRA